MSKPDGGAAFPESYVGADMPHEGIGNGMTLRDYFAAAALQGMASQWYLSAKGIEIDCDDVSGDAYRLADAMLKAREQ